MLQGHKPNTAPQGTLKDLFCMKYYSPFEKVSFVASEMPGQFLL